PHVPADDQADHDRDRDGDRDPDREPDPPIPRVRGEDLGEQRYAKASSSARRTSTFTRWRRYSADPNASSGGAVPSSARAAADAGSAPPPTASSTPAARSGVSPMFVRPTWTPPFARTAETPTTAQSCARRWNFMKLHPALAFGTRISVSTSSGASAVSKSDLKKSVAATVRVPFGPCATKSASSASSPAGTSPGASPAATSDHRPGSSRRDPSRAARWPPRPIRLVRTQRVPGSCRPSLTFLDRSPHPFGGRRLPHLGHAEVRYGIDHRIDDGGRR